MKRCIVSFERELLQDESVSSKLGIPEMSEGEHSNVGVILFAVGFILMMALDVALG